MKTFTRYQLKLLTACFICYFCAYIGRLNMSAALNDIITDVGVTSAVGGLLQTLFAASYAAGQLVSGTLSDKVEPRRLILVGLIGSAASNGIFALMHSFAALAVVWTVNGMFQSMLWTPIVKLIAENFDTAARRSASLVMSFTLAAGHFFAWLLAGVMADVFSWRMSFGAPAFILAACAVFAFLALPRGEKGSRKSAGTQAQVPLWTLLRGGLLLVLLGCVANGFVRDSVITWGPTILGSSSDSMLFSLIIPVINLFGIILGAYLVHKVKASTRMVIGGMMAAVGVLSLMVLAFNGLGVIVLALLLGMVSAVLYGSNPLITTLTPLEYDWAGRVGLVAGLIDCSIYVGSSLSGTLVGYIHDVTGGWNSIYLVWIIAGALGAACIFASAKAKRRS